MIDVGACGVSIIIAALQTFPVGFEISEFSDDKDPLTIEESEANGFELLYDGSIFTFSKAYPILVSLSVIPGSDEDINCRILLQGSSSSVSLLPIADVTSMVITYPNNGFVTLSNGKILKGPLADSVQQNGRKKGNTYSFVFGTFAGAQSVKQVAAEVLGAVISLL